MRLVKIIISLFLLLSITGCWGSRETDEVAYSLALGFDKGPGEFITMTFQIANPNSNAGSPGNGKGGAMLTTSTIAHLPIAAFTLINTEQTREVSLLHNTAYIFSEELAREGIHDYLSALNRFWQVRGSAYVYICQGKARDFIKDNKPVLEANSAKQFELESMMNEIHSLSVTTRLNPLYQYTKSGSREAVVPLVAITETDISNVDLSKIKEQSAYLAGELPSEKGTSQFLGAAVFKQDKMVGKINGDEARFLNMITGNLNRGFILLDDPLEPENKVGLAIYQAKKPDIKIRFDEGKTIIEEHIYLEPEILNIPSGINYESVELKPILEEEIRTYIKEKCTGLVAKTQDRFDSDIFGFGRYAKSNFLINKEWDDTNWKKLYPQAEYDLKVFVKIRRTGLMMKSDHKNK